MKKKTLVIVESPSKAKTINKYLGSEYSVEASVGHIKDLITYKLGVDIKRGFQPKYTLIKGKGQVVKKLKTSSANAKNVLIATDPDREGEAIAWHIADEIRSENPNIKRVLFNEITKSGIEKGLKEPRDISEKLFMSQQARRVMDRLIGYQVSPFLSKAMLSKTTKSLSAGRVQSVALRLICERENEINNFVPIDFWNIVGQFENDDKKTIKAKLYSYDGKQIKNPEGSGLANTIEEKKQLDKKLAKLHFINTEEKAKELIERIKKEQYKISDISKKQIKKQPSAPFTTSSLQQEASKRLGFSNKKTMIIAQTLYEGITLGKEGAVGLITYMRTDSVRVSPEAQNSAREKIQNQYGKDYLPPKPPEFASKSKNVQDAHEAIRPTNLTYTPDYVSKFLNRDESKLYEMIYNRFLASQMAPALIDQTTITIEGGSFVFKTSGSVVAFNGFMILFEDIEEEQNGNDSLQLPEGLTKDQNLNLLNVDYIKSQTKPRPHYTEASLIKELDELGIGRPSTYSTIVSTLIEREYVELQKKIFHPTPLGIEVNEILIKNFPDIFNIVFTAEMEKDLDTIAEGEKTYLEVMNNFYAPFHKALHIAESQTESESIKCDLCGAPMVIRVSKKGRFLGCSRYPDCKNVKPLPEIETDKKAKKELIIAEGIHCDICGKEMVIREGKYGRFYGCIDYPKCKGIKPISSGVTCPKCKEGELTERISTKTKRKFWACSRYPDCEYLSNNEPVNKKCENCGYPILFIHFRKKDNEWEKYYKCPECKTSFDIEG
ncbi:MAG: type I DNA topoisomerase [Candidatus Woesearchaeota archaeon]